MGYKTVFERYELKYLLTNAQKDAVLNAMSPYMALDEYGRTVIRNIYFDTPNFRLIRASIEKPIYKEKLRVRSYSKATAQINVFVELKKKYKSVVYKRRLSLPEQSAMDWVQGNRECSVKSQISSEIDYFLAYYQTLRPAVFLSYAREAYYPINGGSLRITFDDDILCRQTDLSLKSEAWGTPILDSGLTLMEIKCSGGIPLWLTRVLSENQIYKTSFSKYGTAYKKLIYPALKEEFIYA